VSRKVRIVLLCEDRQHETFVKRFLRRDGWNLRDFRVVLSPQGRGSAEQFVRERFPHELQAVRTKRGERVWLIVMIDGDDKGANARRESLNAACEAQGITAPSETDNALICVPTWSIETWFAFLDGREVDESVSDHPRLDRVRDCAVHAERLAEICRDKLPGPTLPPSLEDSCTQYTRLFNSDSFGRANKS